MMVAPFGMQLARRRFRLGNGARSGLGKSMRNRRAFAFPGVSYELRMP